MASLLAALLVMSLLLLLVPWPMTMLRWRYPWGGALTPGGAHRANVWQGKLNNMAKDGWAYTAPVRSMEPQNALGFHHLIFQQQNCQRRARAAQRRRQ